MHRAPAPLLALVALCSASLLLDAGCASDNGTKGSAVTAAGRADLSPSDRVRAIHRAQADMASGEVDPTVLRLAMKKLAWSLDTPEPVRAAALESVLWDAAHEDDSLQLVQEMLPTEPGRQAVAVLCTAAADHGWVAATPQIVRSFGRPVQNVKDADRAEFKALAALHPGVPLEQVVMQVFLDPQTDPGPAGLRLDMRTREAAWDILGRLEPDTAARAALLHSASGGDQEGEAILTALETINTQLGVVPRSGEELRWALRMNEQREKDLATWWTQTSAAAAGVTQDASTREMRHLEPIRWASLNHPGWLSSDRETLLAELASRIKGRQVYTRTKEIRGNADANAERLATARDGLSWGDVLALLVIDEATRDPGIASAIFAAADEDHDDGTTEHGGTLWADARGFHAQSFAPRGTASPDDRRFTAPREMIEFSTAALAHFHFHVADWRNRDYAGPSPGDFDYAARFGRSCVVFSGIGHDALDVDVYFPTGSVVDLGELARP